MSNQKRPHIMMGQAMTSSNIGESSQPPPKPLPVDDGSIDPASKARADRFHKIQVKRVEHMSAAEYNAIYRPWTFVNEHVMEQCEEIWRMLTCHCCRTVDSRGRITGFPFFVTVENDELGVFPALAHMTCHQCGFEEYYPTSKPLNYANPLRGMSEDSLSGMTKFPNVPPPNMSAQAIQDLYTNFEQQRNQMQRSIAESMGMAAAPPALSATEMRLRQEKEKYKRMVAEKNDSEMKRGRSLIDRLKNHFDP